MIIRHGSASMGRFKSIFAVVLCWLMLFSGISHAEVKKAADSEILDQYIQKMPLEAKIAQMLLYSFPGTRISDDFKAVMQKYPIGGTVLYGSNVGSISQLVTLTDQLQKAAGKLPLFIAMDQEGGSVIRIPSSTAMPGNLALGAANSKETTYQVAKAIGEEISSVGVNLNFSPVLDVLPPKGSNVLGTRSFGTSPALVSNMGSAYIQGLQASGVLACAKHFPGIGSALEDSHDVLPIVTKNAGILKAVDFLPFQAAVHTGVDMIMIAHVAYPTLDNTKIKSKKDGKEIYVPASLSYKILTKLLRNEMGFEGVIVTDSLQMKAITNNLDSQGDAAVLAVKAGSDLVILQVAFTSVFQRLLNAVKSKEISETRINSSVKRILNLKLKKGILKVVNNNLVPGDAINASLEVKIKKAAAMVGSKAHKSIEQSAAAAAVQTLKNDDGLLPLTVKPGESLVIFAPSDRILGTVRNQLEQVLSQKNIQNVFIKGYNYQFLNAITSLQKQRILSADHVILCTTGKIPDEKESARNWGIRFQTSLISIASSSNKPLIALGTGIPDERDSLPEIKTYIAAFGNNKCNLVDMVKSIFVQD